MKSIFLLIVIVLTVSAQGLRERLDSLYKLPSFDTTLMALDIKNLNSGEVIYSRNNKMLLHPASNMKILTSMAGLVFLGPDYKFKTTFTIQGEVIRGTLFGDLIVRGEGDPDLESSIFDSVLTVIKSLGIKRINGNIVGDVSYQDSVFWGNGWMWDDDPSTDFPYLTPLTINDNAITIVVSASDSTGKISVTSIPATGYITIRNNAVISTSNRNNVNITRNYFEHKDEIVLSGEIPAGKTAKSTVNLRNPSAYFLTLLKEKLEEDGIKVSGKTKTTREYIYTSPDTILVNGVRLDSIIVNLNKTSDNLSTEMLLRALAVKHSGEPATSGNGVKLVDSLIRLAGFNPSNYRIVDGSGVSHYNLISAELLLGLLEYLHKNYADKPEYTIFLNSLPIAGVDGSLRNRMKNTAAQGKVFAKTGTLSGVSCLSGYTTNSRGETIVFSIMMQNHYRNIRRVLEIQNYICAILSE